MCKNYYFIKSSVPDEAERKANNKLKFIFVNGKFGDSFNKPVNKVAGCYPEHLQKFAISSRKKRVVKKTNIVKESE